MTGRIKVVISGGPCAGMTTLLNSLKVTFPSAHFVEEDATMIIQSELAKLQADATYSPIVPWVNPILFGKRVFEQYIALEKSIPNDTTLVTLDRSLVDVVGYSRSVGNHDRASQAMRLAMNANYDVVVFCQPVGDYETSMVRSEDREQAAQMHKWLWDAYVDSGVTMVELSNQAISERVSRVQEVIANLRDRTAAPS